MVIELCLHFEIEEIEESEEEKELEESEEKYEHENEDYYADCLIDNV